jgi:hypothetical protein
MGLTSAHDSRRNPASSRRFKVKGLRRRAPRVRHWPRLPGHELSMSTKISMRQSNAPRSIKVPIRQRTRPSFARCWRCVRAA